MHNLWKAMLKMITLINAQVPITANDKCNIKISSLAESGGTVVDSMVKSCEVLEN